MPGEARLLQLRRAMWLHLRTHCLETLRSVRKTLGSARLRSPLRVVCVAALAVATLSSVAAAVCVVSAWRDLHAAEAGPQPWRRLVGGQLLAPGEQRVGFGVDALLLRRREVAALDLL